MLFRLYNVEEDTLLIDNYDIMHLPIKMVRDVIGYCPQDNFLFSDTIKTNIAFSNPDMKMEDVGFSSIRKEFSDTIAQSESMDDVHISITDEEMDYSQEQEA